MKDNFSPYSTDQRNSFETFFPQYSSATARLTFETVQQESYPCWPRNVSTEHDSATHTAFVLTSAPMLENKSVITENAPQTMLVDNGMIVIIEDNSQCLPKTNTVADTPQDPANRPELLLVDNGLVVVLDDDLDGLLKFNALADTPQDPGNHPELLLVDNGMVVVIEDSSNCLPKLFQTSEQHSSQDASVSEQSVKDITVCLTVDAVLNDHVNIYSVDTNHSLHTLGATFPGSNTSVPTHNLAGFGSDLQADILNALFDPPITL